MADDAMEWTEHSALDLNRSRLLDTAACICSVWSPVAGTYKYHTSCCNGECYDRAAEKPGKRCSIWNKAELFSQHLAHAQLTAEADCEVVVEFIELCLKTFTGAAAANTSLAELALAAYEVLPLSEASADDIPLDRVKESIAVAVEELLFVEARVLPVCFNPEFSDDTAVDRALEASLAPIVSQIQPKHVGAGDYLSREDFGEALAEFQRINEVRTPRSKVLCIVRTFLELQKLGALAKTGKGKKHEGADELVPRFEYILLIAHGNTEAPIQLVTNTKFIQRFLCGSRRYWHQHGVCEYLLITLYGMCESLRNGDLPKFTEDFVPVDKSNKWLSDVEPYDADVLLTEDLTAVPGTFILAPKLAARKLVGFRGEKCEAYHLSVKLVLNRNYQNRPGGGGGGGGGGRGPMLLPSRPIGRSASTESTRRMYSYTIDQDEHDAHGKDFKAELKAAGYLDVRLATLEDVVEFCRLKPLRLGLHGGIVFPTRQKFFRSDHDSTAAASASLELPFPLGNDRGGQQMGNVQGRMPTWKVEVASAEPPASRVGGSTSVSIALGLRAGSNASSQSLPIEHNFSEDTDGGGGSSGASGGGGGGGGGGAAASSGKLIVWTLSAPPAMRRKNPLEDLGIGICWDLHDDKLGPFVCWVSPGSPAEERGICPGFFLTSVQCGADMIFQDRATMREGLLEAIRVAQPIPVDPESGAGGGHMIESGMKVILSFTETSGAPLPSGGRTAPTMPARFSVCKDWHVTQTLLEIERGGEDLSIHETAALSTVQLGCVKVATGATQAHDDRHTEPHAYACYFGNEDVAETTVPVYLCFAGGVANQNALKQPLLLSECQWLTGKVMVSLDRLAKRVPLEPLINLLNKKHNGKPIKLIFTGHSIGGGVAQLVALRLLSYIDSLEEMETRRRVLEAETLASNASMPEEHAAATAMLKDALDLDRKKERRERNLALMSNVHAVVYGSPMVCDHIFGKAAQTLLEKGGSTFTFFSAHGDLIPWMLAALSVYETGIHEQAATNNSSRRKQYRSLVDGMARLIARVDAYTSISSLREIASKLKLTRAGPANNATGSDDPGPSVVNGVITILSRCVERGVAADFGIFGNWFRYDERKRPHAIDLIEQLRAVLQFMQSPSELQAKDTEIMVRNHAFVNFRHHFSPQGGGALVVTHPHYEVEVARKLTAGCFGDALCHQSRVVPGPEWAATWGKPKLAAAASPECSVVTRTSSHVLSQMLTLVVTGEHLSFVTKVKVTLDGQQQLGADCVPDFSSTDSTLRVTTELKTPVGTVLHGAKLLVMLQSHFARKTWETHSIHLPEELVEAAWLLPRESRVASLDLGQLLNEAIVCSSFGVSIPDRHELTRTLAELELGKNETEDSRWTKQALSHYKDTVDKVTDKETGNMLPGVEGLLTFSVTSQQVKKLGTIVVGKKGEDVKSFVHGFEETQEHDGDIAARQRAANIIGDDVERNAKFQRDLSVATLADADGVAASQHVPALKFEEAISRHNLPTYNAAAAWSVGTLTRDRNPDHRNSSNSGGGGGGSGAGLATDAKDGGDGEVAENGEGAVPPGILTAKDALTLEKESAGRRDVFVFRDKVATPFGHHFQPGKVCRANVLSGIVEIDFTLSAAQAGIRGRRFARPECLILNGMQLDKVTSEGRVKFMGLHKPHSGGAAGPDFSRKLPFVWDAAVHEEPRTRKGSSSGRQTGVSEVVTAVRSLMSKAVQEGHGLIYISLQNIQSTYTLKYDFGSSTVSTASSTEYNQLPAGLSGDSFDHGVPRDGRGACYTIMVLPPKGIDEVEGAAFNANAASGFAAATAATPCTSTARTVVVQVWEHQRYGALRGYNAPLRPKLFGDSAPFLLSAPIAAYENVETTSPAETDIAPPEGYRWVDHGWRKDNGTLRVRLHDGMAGVAERDMETCGEADVVNVGRSFSSAGSTDMEGWQYRWKYHAAEGWVDRSPAPLHVRRRRWLRRCELVTLDTPDTPADPAAAAGQPVPAGLSAALMSGWLQVGSSANISRYFVLTSAHLYWFAAEPKSSLDFGACMGSMPTAGLAVLPPAHTTRHAAADAGDGGGGSGSRTAGYSDVYERMVRNEDAVKLAWCDVGLLVESGPEAHQISVPFGGFGNTLGLPPRCVRIGNEHRDRVQMWRAALQSVTPGAEPLDLEATAGAWNAHAPTATRTVGGVEGVNVSRHLYGLYRCGERVQYLPLVADVQLAVWRRIRQILSRFAFAKLPDPKSRRGAFLVAGGVVAAGLVLVPVAGIAVAVPGLIAAVAGTTLWAIAATTAMSAIGRYVTTMLDQEQQLYSQNLAIACELLGISRGRHGMQVYCMEREINDELHRKLEMLADTNHLDSSRPKALLDSLVDNEDQWNAKLIATRSFQKVTARQRKRERQEIADFLLDVSRIFHMRQTLVRSFKVGVVGPTKSGKSKFLSSLGRRSGADAMKHTLDITAHWFKPDDPKVASTDDRLVMIDFPGYDDTGTRVGEAFARHHNICDAYLFVVQIDKIDTPELQGRFQSAVASGRPVCCCLNKADTALMKEAPLPEGVADGSQESNQKVHRGFEAEVTAGGSGIPRVPRLKEELWEDVREKIESLLQNLAARDSDAGVGAEGAAGGGGGGLGGLVIPPEEVRFDMRESKAGFLRFGQDGPLQNLTVVLTTFDRREWASDITLDLVQESEIVSASEVFDSWVLESMQHHCGSAHFCRKDILESVFKRSDGSDDGIGGGVGDVAGGGGNSRVGHDAAPVSIAPADGAVVGAGAGGGAAGGGGGGGRGSSRSSDPSTWSSDEVCSWLEERELSNVAAAFRECEFDIDGALLVTIDCDEVLEEAGLKSKLARMKVLSEIKKLISTLQGSAVET
eukprot:gene1170-15797_t